MLGISIPERWLLAGPLIAVGLLVIAALLGGEAVARWLRAPRIVGYAATGIALGGLGIVPHEQRDVLRLAIDFSMGAVLFELGGRIDLGWLRRAPWLSALAIGEIALAGIALFWMLRSVFELPAAHAACGAALGIATSPAVGLWIAQDQRAQGQVTERMLLLNATSTALAVIALAVLAPTIGRSEAIVSRGGLLAGGVAVATSLGLAALLAAIALGVFSALGKRRETQLAATFGAVALGAGAAAAAGLSIPLVLFAFGLFVRAVDRGRRALPLEFGRAGQLAYVLLFALVGASLDLRAAAGVAVAGVAFIAVRAVAKSAAVILFARATRQPLRQAALLALALQPMSGVTFVLAHDVSLALPALATTVVPIVLAAIVMLELLGPICVQISLRLAGEAEPLPA